jgi:hypothetical protein
MPIPTISKYLPEESNYPYLMPCICDSIFSTPTALAILMAFHVIYITIKFKILFLLLRSIIANALNFFLQTSSLAQNHKGTQNLI